MRKFFLSLLAVALLIVPCFASESEISPFAANAIVITSLSPDASVKIGDEHTLSVEVKVNGNVIYPITCTWYGSSNGLKWDEVSTGFDYSFVCSSDTYPLYRCLIKDLWGSNSVDSGAVHITVLSSEPDPEPDPEPEPEPDPEPEPEPDPEPDPEPVDLSPISDKLSAMHSDFITISVYVIYGIGLIIGVLLGREVLAWIF